MNPITKLIASTVVGLIVATLVAVVVLISAGHAHAGMTSSTNTFAVSYIERGGGHGHRTH
jgi:hypothetical protein